MNKTLKKVLIVVAVVIGLLVLTHVTVNYLVPFIMQMHGTAAY